MPRKLDSYIEAKRAGKKYCPGCNRYHSPEEFYHSSRTNDGLSTYCKTFETKRHAEFRKTHRAALNEYNRKRYYEKKGVSMPEKQVSMFEPCVQHTGVYCKTCGKELQHYDVPQGECFCHRLGRVRAARETKIMLTDEHIRTRTRRNYHIGKAIGA